MVIEVARDQRDINIACLADRLAVIHRLQDSEQTRMFLHLPGDGVEVARADVSRCRAPSGERLACRSHRRCDIRVAALRNLDQRLPGGRVDAGEIVAVRWRTPLVADEEAEPWGMCRQPLPRGRCRLRRGTIAHRLE